VSEPVPLRDVVRIFLQLGLTAFGGPVAHIALMHDQLVRRRRWMTDADFTDLLAVTNLIPGPNSTEMALHIGRRVAGWWGFLVAGVCFAGPSIVMVLLLAYLYVSYGGRADARAVLAGLGPVVIAVVAQAVWRLATSILTNARTIAVALAAAIAGIAGVQEVAVIFGGGLALAALSARRVLPVVLTLGMEGTLATASATGAAAIGPLSLGLYFLKIGSILFGSGYVLVAFLRADLVDRWALLTDAQLLDAVAAGQMTPGPLSTTATFIGYVLAGWPGAIAATAGMFAPACAFVALTGPLIPRLRRSRAAAGFLDGAAAASLALMAVVTITLARTTLVDPFAIGLAAAAAAALLVGRVNALWVVLAGAAAGLLRLLVQRGIG
jgi:chromate transporter